MVKKQPSEGSEARRLPFVLRHWLFVLFCIVLASVLIGPTVYTNLTTDQVRYEPARTAYADVPVRDVAIVLGAGLQKRGTEPSPYLRWRIETAAALYKAGRVKKLLMSGARMGSLHDEPRIMQQTAEALGVPAADIVQDGLGLDTYDSCKRAYDRFRITNAAIITQGYHMPRAVLSCRVAGIDAIGVNAHTQVRSWRAGWYLLREWLATDKLFIQLALHKLGL